MPKRADHFGVTGMADQNDGAAFLAVASCIHMHLGNQRAGSIQIDHVAALRFGGDRFWHTMGGEYDGKVFGHLVQFLDKDRALAAQFIHHIFIVNDFMAHIDREAEFIERFLDNFNGPVDAGTKATGAGEHYG